MKGKYITTQILLACLSKTNTGSFLALITLGLFAAGQAVIEIEWMRP